MTEPREVWHMPQWMEPYRTLITNTGGNSVESLMNDKATSSFNNLLRWTLICSVRSQVTMLERTAEMEPCSVTSATACGRPSRRYSRPAPAERCRA
jgi:hypothetical protein